MPSNRGRRLCFRGHEQRERCQTEHGDSDKDRASHASVGRARAFREKLLGDASVGSALSSPRSPTIFLPLLTGDLGPRCVFVGHVCIGRTPVD